MYFVIAMLERFPLCVVCDYNARKLSTVCFFVIVTLDSYLLFVVCDNNAGQLSTTWCFL